LHVAATVLFFYDVFDLAKFGLFACPDLNETLRASLVPDDV